jgi:hypothetical protein
VEPTETPAARFCIDTQAIERSGRSFEVMVEQRLCAAARRNLGERAEERRPVKDDAGGVSFAARGGERSAMSLIRRYCSDDLEYLHPDLTVLEACFRILLLAGNQPMSIADIRQELDHWPSLAEKLRPLPDDQVADVFLRDRYYGIRRAS